MFLWHSHCSIDGNEAAEARGGYGGGMGAGGCGGDSCNGMGAKMAWAGQHGMMGMGAGFEIAAIPELNLSDAQKAEVKKLRKAYQKDIYLIEDKMIAQRRQMRELLSETSPNEDKLFAIRKEMLEARNQLSQKTLDYEQKVLKILTPEQKEKIKELRANGRCPMMGQYQGRAGAFGDNAPRGRMQHQQQQESQQPQ